MKHFSRSKLGLFAALVTAAILAGCGLPQAMRPSKPEKQIYVEPKRSPNELAVFDWCGLGQHVKFVKLKSNETVYYSLGGRWEGNRGPAPGPCALKFDPGDYSLWVSWDEAHYFTGQILRGPVNFEPGRTYYLRGEESFPEKGARVRLEEIESGKVLLRSHQPGSSVY